MTSAQRSTVDDRTMSEINITPFTDVLLVLLIIFMLLAALATPPGFQKSLTRPSASGAHKDREPIRVEIASSSRIFVDGRIVPPDALGAALAAAVRLHESDPKRLSPHIQLLASDGVPYQTIVDVLDAGRSAGDDDVGLVLRRSGP